MSSNLSNQELIFHTLLYNQPFYKELCKDFISQRNEILEKEDPSLKNDIDRQFISMVKSEITKNLAQRHAISTEEILIVLENVNLQEYLL
jgi:hypothetical protein